MTNETEEQYQDRLRKAAIMSAPRGTEFEFSISGTLDWDGVVNIGWNWSAYNYRIKPAREIVDDEVYLFWRSTAILTVPELLSGDRVRSLQALEVDFTEIRLLPYAEYKHLRNTQIKDIPADVVEKARMK